MPRREIAPQVLLAALPLFKTLDEATLARLAAAAKRRPLARAELLFRQGDAPQAMYVVVHGEIHLVARTPSGGERLTGIVGPGRSFGEPVMFLERPAVVDALAATDALVLALPKEAVFAEIERDPRFARLMMANLSRRVEMLVQELDRQALGGGRAKLVHYLVRRADQSAGPQVVTLPATKAAVASQLHLTPEHFSRLLRELADEGLLRVEGRSIVVPDLQRLAAGAKAGPAAAAPEQPAQPPAGAGTA